jgi:biotin operon repressor
MKLTKRQQIYNLVKNNPNKEMSIEQIADAMGLTKQQVSMHVTNMKRVGNLRNTRHGFYATIGDGYKRGKKAKRVPVQKINLKQMELPLEEPKLSENPNAHKHAKIIKAWADGAKVEGRLPTGEWVDCVYPNWSPDCEFRVKPKVIPDEVRYVMANIADFYIELTESHHKLDNLKLTFDGATRQLKYSEVLK